jgi:hypothetical protein
MKTAIIAVCIVGVLLGVLITFPADARPGLDDIRAKHETKLIATKGVSGVASDKATNEIVVYTETQKDCEKVPKELDGFKVRCEAIGRIEALQPAAVATPDALPSLASRPASQRWSRTGTDRPVFGGISVGSSAYPGSAGTLGLVTSSGQVLSNAHVLAMDSSASFQQADVWQPGGYDRGTAASKIGTLTKYTSIQFNDDGATNYADAAYATLSTNIAYKAKAVLNAANTGWVTISSVSGVAKQGDIVSKSGRTTGVTTGTVSQTGVTVKVYYWNSKYAVFKDQLAISNRASYQQFCKAGDSGSVIYNANGQFVGLLFAAGSNQNGMTVVTFANTAAHVTGGLGITAL